MKTAFSGSDEFAPVPQGHFTSLLPTFAGTTLHFSKRIAAGNTTLGKISFLLGNDRIEYMPRNVLTRSCEECSEFLGASISKNKKYQSGIIEKLGEIARLKRVTQVPR